MAIAIGPKNFNQIFVKQIIKMNKNTIQSKPSGIFLNLKRISLFDLDTKSFSKIIKNIKAIVKNFIIIEK